MGGESGKQRRASSKEFNLLSPDTSYFFGMQYDANELFTKKKKAHGYAYCFWHVWKRMKARLLGFHSLVMWEVTPSQFFSLSILVIFVRATIPGNR